MGDVYKILESLLQERGISGSKMSADLGMSRSFMTELRKGRAKSITADTAQKIANYFGVSVEYLLGQEIEKAPTNEGERDDELTELLDMLRTRPECRMLFSLAKGATKADVERAVAIIEALREKEGR